MDKFWQALASLLPTGYAWPRDPSSTLMRVLRGLAAALSVQHEFARSTALDWMPHQTTTRLVEWEEACGLPCDCMEPDQSLARRKAMLLATLRGAVGSYGDSSPAAPGAIAALAAGVGYEATVAYNTPMRVGVSCVGSPLGALDGQLYVTVKVEQEPMCVGLGTVGSPLARCIFPEVDTPDYFRAGVSRVGEALQSASVRRAREPMRAGVSRVGDRLEWVPTYPSDLVCLLQRVLPARFDPQFSLSFVNVPVTRSLEWTIQVAQIL